MTDDGGTELAVLVSDERRRDGSAPVDSERWAGLARSVLMAEGVASGELGLLFVDADEIARLNRVHRGEDRPTDVLAFPLDGRGEPDPPGGPALIGDVVVCPAYVLSAVSSAGCGDVGSAGSPRGAVGCDVPGSGAALAMRVVHGVLHVLGYDHIDDDDAAVMRRRERELTACSHGPSRGESAASSVTHGRGWGSSPCHHSP